MARKSRRQSESINVVAEVKEKVFKTALYVRLSIEDVRDRKDSDSIENQTYLLKQFVEERPYLQVYSIYIDNGEKGTNFDRPEFNRLMDDIKAQKVNCIVVKDLSRFGRDYIETGNYLEKIFPFLGVRFISINDNYDSFRPECDNEGLIISLKNLLNDVYAKDISKKIISSFRDRQSKGEFLGAHVPYGYLRPTDGSYKLIIDEEAAKVIRLIYRWKIKGLSDTKIARNLNDLSIPSPSKYKYLKGKWKNIRYNDSIWQRQTIKTITENEVYLGHKIYGKIQASLYEGKKKSRVSKDQWRIIENDHEPIIDKETFNIIHEERLRVYDAFIERINKNKCYENSENVFKDIAVCGDCKTNLVRRRRIKNSKLSYYFSCITFETNSGYKCTRKHILEKDLINVVYCSITKQIEISIKIENLVAKLRANASFLSSKEINLSKLRKIETEIKRKQSLSNIIYDDYIEGVISHQEYLYAKTKYENDTVKLKEKKSELQIECRKYNENYLKENKWMSKINLFKKEEKLTREIVTALIEKIEIYNINRVEVIFKFHDEYLEILNDFGIAEEEVI